MLSRKLAHLPKQLLQQPSSLGFSRHAVFWNSCIHCISFLRSCPCTARSSSQPVQHCPRHRKLVAAQSLRLPLYEPGISSTDNSAFSGTSCNEISGKVSPVHCPVCQNLHFERQKRAGGTMAAMSQSSMPKLRGQQMERALRCGCSCHSNGT